MVVKVEFKQSTRESLVAPDDVSLQVGDSVVCKLEKGEEMMGKVVRLEASVKESGLTGRILRVATQEDVERHNVHLKLEREAFATCQQLIADKKLPMKLVDVESVFDGKRMRFYFLAERRVDFRELVGELARIFKTRIEMRQIGVRDYAKLLRGVGPCGRVLCCTTFLKEFEPVSMEIAKEQSLLLSPSKLSGVCGRLMCCLNYERFLYQGELKRFPPIGSTVETEKGRATVSRIDIFREVFYVKGEGESEEEVSLERWQKRKKRHWRFLPRKREQEEV